MFDFLVILNLGVVGKADGSSPLRSGCRFFLKIRLGLLSIASRVSFLVRFVSVIPVCKKHLRVPVYISFLVLPLSHFSFSLLLLPFQSALNADFYAVGLR